LILLKISKWFPALGKKIVSVFPKNIEKNLPSIPATMIAFDATTDIVNAVLDCTYLTQLRTVQCKD
jgi:ornithine cyclodeaminase